MKANNLIIRLKSPCKEWLGRLNRSYLILNVVTSTGWGNIVLPVNTVIAQN